jgi:hypothetical protein
MNLKLKRVVRTPYSEEIAIFDNGTHDENDDAVSIGKLEVHYLSDQMVGTLLIWSEFVQGFRATHGPDSGLGDTLDDVIDDILSEVSEALGVSAEYGIEVYYPSVINQSFVSNYADEDDDEDEETEGEEYEMEEAEQDELEDTEVEDGSGDDYQRKLAGR